jgi:hypothetical protein
MRGEAVLKIGVTSDLRRRQKALNVSFPPAAQIGWKIIRQQPFVDRASAIQAEDAFKCAAVDRDGQSSLGGEFFVMPREVAEALFTSLSVPTGLTIRVSR